MSKIGIVIEREYMERVKKKSFIITTILMPVFMVILMAMPALIMMFSEETVTNIAVIDNSGEILPQLRDRESIKFFPAQDASVDSVLVRENVDAVLVIPANVITNPKASIKLYSDGATPLSTEGSIASDINSYIEQQRLRSYNITDLDQILKDVQSNLVITPVRVDKDSEEAVSSMFSYVFGIGMSFVLYMFLLIYGQMVMNSIIDEKGNRVLEVVVSSIKPMQLMMGKIIGVALVAVTQIVLWGVLVSVLAPMITSLLPADALADIAAVQAGNFDGLDPEEIPVIQAVGMLGDVGHILSLVAIMTVFLILGFLLYSSIFAAVGSAVDNLQDASQLTSLAVIPIVFGIIFGTVAATDPNGQLAFWTSLFPLTSPMVMVARLPFGIPAWEIWLSIALLILGFLGLVWVAGKIYRVGIFMYGKKPTIKELMRWVTYK